MSMAKYTEGIAADGAAILKDGHTMMVQDVVRDLNRKSFLEQKRVDLMDSVKKYHQGLTDRKNGHVIAWECLIEIQDILDLNWEG